MLIWDKVDFVLLYLWNHEYFFLIVFRSLRHSSVYMQLLLYFKLGTGEGSQGSHPQICSACLWVADTGSPLHEGVDRP